MKKKNTLKGKEIGGIKKCRRSGREGTTEKRIILLLTNTEGERNQKTNPQGR